MCFKFKRFCRRFHRNRKYINKDGKSFTEGRKFSMNEFLDYYNTFTDDEWDEAVEMAAEKGYDISNIKLYIRVYGRDLLTPMGFYEVRDKLLGLHGFDEPMWATCMGVVPIEEERRNIEELYASMGVPVSEYWKEKLWR